MSHLQRVVYLDAFFTELTNEQVQDIYRFKHLTNLRLAWHSCYAWEATPPRNSAEDGLEPNGVGTSDEAYRGLGKLKNLEVLRLTGCPLGANFNAEVSSLKKLKHLEVGRTTIDDTGLRKICKLENLEVLDLFETNITDAGMSPAPHWLNLRYLNIEKTNLSDSGMRFLKDAHNLTNLRAANTMLGDEVCMFLANHASVKGLDLSYTKVSGKNFSHWGKMRELKELRLDGTAVDDAAVDALPPFPKLEYIGLSECKTSKHILLHFVHLPAIRRWSVTTHTLEDWRELAKTHPQIRENN